MAEYSAVAEALEAAFRENLMPAFQQARYNPSEQPDFDSGIRAGAREMWKDHSTATLCPYHAGMFREI